MCNHVIYTLLELERNRVLTWYQSDDVGHVKNRIKNSNIDDLKEINYDRKGVQYIGGSNPEHSWILIIGEFTDWSL